MSIGYDKQIKIVFGLGVLAVMLLAALVVLTAMREKARYQGATAVASALPPPAPSSTTPAPKKKREETLCFATLTEHGREVASERCRRREGRPDVTYEKVVCYSSTQRYKKLFTYTATDAMVEDEIPSGAGGSP